MLRNLFLFLLLTNVVLFAWQHWIVPPEVADPRAAKDLPDAGLPLAVGSTRPQPRAAAPVTDADPDSETTDLDPPAGPEPAAARILSGRRP